MLLSCVLFTAQALGQLAEQPARFEFPTHLALKSLDWDTRQGDPPITGSLRLNRRSALRAGYWFVQTDPHQFHAVRRWIGEQGGVVFDYLPHNAFEARLSEELVHQLKGHLPALYPVHPAWKLDPQIGLYQTALEDADGKWLVAVELWPDRNFNDEEQRFHEAGAEILEHVASGRYARVLLRVAREDLASIARIAAVKWIEESAPAVFRNDEARWILQTNQTNQMRLWARGITGAGVTIGHIDGRLFLDSCYFDDPSGVSPGPNHRKVKWMSAGVGGNSHGTHTAGTAVGDRRPFGGSSGSGMAPDAWLVHESELPNSANFLAKLANAHSHGARIHTNSWGNDFSTSYDNWTRDIDAYSHDNEDGLVIFAVTNKTLLRNPENAKSSLSVGATEVSNPDLHASGGMGPTDDGRLKPEIMAPGCDLVSAASGANCMTIAMCGTSMAAPVIAGGAAMLKQYFEEGRFPSGLPNPSHSITPSGSLLRACMANSGVDLQSEMGFPGYREGWGRALLDDVVYFPGDAVKFRMVDIPHAQGVSHQQTRARRLNIPAGSSMLRITMAYADEPGSAFANLPVVNDLSLIALDPNGVRYGGNIINTFTGASFPDTTAKDHLNSLEVILVPNPAPGRWTIKVEGTDVLVGPQGFAVVATF